MKALSRKAARLRRGVSFLAILVNPRNQGSRGKEITQSLTGSGSVGRTRRLPENK